MADDGASSSSNSVDEVDDGQESKVQSYSTSTNFISQSSNDTSNAAVSSSGHIASSSQGIIGMSRLSCNPFAIKSSTPTRSVADSTDNKECSPLVAPPTLKFYSAPKIVLRPSALAVQAEKLKLFNKHDSSTKQEGKENSSDESNVAKDERISASESNGRASKAELFTTSGISTSSDIQVSSSSKSYAAENNAFCLSQKKVDDLPSNGGFVFGQNLHERALNYASSVSENTAMPPDSHNLTFEEAALKKEDLEKMEQQNQEEKVKKSLIESAKEYEARQVKRKYDEVEVITGEENESNVLRIYCKLYAFDKITMQWQQRGIGTLRLNDSEQNGCLQSRVVMRVQGSHRVVLNTNVWAGMTVELVEHPNSQKSVRFTAFDPEAVDPQVFLVKAQQKDADKLFNALNCRVSNFPSENLGNNDDSLSAIEEASLSTVEEATSSSSTLPDNSDPPRKHSRLSDNSCGADSSTETTSFVPQDSETSESGCADSTDVQP